MTKSNHANEGTWYGYDPTATPAHGLDMRMSITAKDTEIDPEVAAAARKTIAARSVDAADARRLMEMLGILP